MVMLSCAECGAKSEGNAWHWVAFLSSTRTGPEAVCYCPVCAEAEFGYFSQRVRHPELTEDRPPES